MVKKKLIAFLLTLTMMLSAVTPAFAAGTLADGSNPVTYASLEKIPDEGESLPSAGEESSAASQSVGASSAAQSTEQTLGDALAALFLKAGLSSTQIGSADDCVALADSLGILSKEDYTAETPVTGNLSALLAAYALSADYQSLCEAVKNQTPLFLNGMAQPIFPYTTGSVETGYSNEESDIIRFFVYVETNYDTDGDGKLDLVKALVQLPKSAAMGNYAAATIYEARPYITGCTEGLDYDAGSAYDIDSMYDTSHVIQRAAPASTISSWDDAEAFVATADSSDWYYVSPFESAWGTFMDYEDLDWYDYYLVRGYAVVECGGLGTRDSEGFETCGSDLEIDAFKCVIEWLHGDADRIAYTDKDATTAITAYWSNGNVGMTGRSYSGTTQFGLAATGVEGLKTIVPVAGIASWYEYTNSQGIATSGVAYTDNLASYCAGRYLDSQAAAEYAADLGIEDYQQSGEYDETIADTYPKYLGWLAQQQIDLNGDYASSGENDSNTWEIRDYTTGYGQIADDYYDHLSCPALIVHGLNDENVKTKQFDLMYQTYKAAGASVKLLLHQDGHLTPTYPSSGYAFDINGTSYDELLNQWFSHYLYGVNNGVEKMAEVTAQDSHDPDLWHTYSSWQAGQSVTLTVGKDAAATATVSSNYEKNGITYGNWEQAFATGSTGSSVLYTMDVKQDMVIKGSVAVKFSASVAMEDATLDLSQQDALMVSAMLVDLGPSEGGTFAAINKSGSYVKKETVQEGGAWMGGGLTNFDLVKLTASQVDYKVIGKGWMDLCNPGAGYTSASASTKVALDGSENSYTLYLQPNLYTVEAGHTLGLVICPLDPDCSDYYSFSYDENWQPVATVNPDFQNYTITLKNSSVAAVIPVDQAWSTDSCLTVAKTAFTDVPKGSYFADAVAWATENGITGGTTATTFSPYASCTRAQLVTFLWRAAGKPTAESTVNPFSDVKENSVFYSAILWAAENGIVTGYSDGTFAPSAAVSRQQAAAILYRFAKAQGMDVSVGEDTNILSYQDVFDVAEYAVSAFQWATGAGVVKGTGGNLKPLNTCTRAQIVTMLYRMLAK